MTNSYLPWFVVFRRNWPVALSSPAFSLSPELSPEPEDPPEPPEPPDPVPLPQSGNSVGQLTLEHSFTKTNSRFLQFVPGATS